MQQFNIRCEFAGCYAECTFLVTRNAMTTRACDAHLARLVPLFASVRRLRPVAVRPR
jgi:hypothetical protein